MIQDWLFGDARDPRDVRCRRLVERCGYAAAALTILPIPGSEVIGVMPIHVGMVVGIAEEHGVKLTRESATDLILKIGATVGLSLVGSRIAMTAGKLILPGLGGLVAAPFMFASTLAIGAVARAYFENDGQISDSEMKRVYERTVEKAKSVFDPRKARSSEAKDMAEEAAREEEAKSASKPRASVDDLAERLAKLDELYERGSISERDYEKRKQQILDEV
ncbi:MAG: DUF697 domain-containing protein [Sandaracinaceae bacterium]|nr:DUF697 domain-containing protein [Sandaracinaceae bacterium]